MQIDSFLVKFWSFSILSDELAQLKMNYTSNVHTISDINNTLKENIEECHNLGKDGTKHSNPCIKCGNIEEVWT